MVVDFFGDNEGYHSMNILVTQLIICSAMIRYVKRKMWDSKYQYFGDMWSLSNNNLSVPKIIT